MLMRNLGPPWRRYRSNTVVPHGGTFEATSDDVARFKLRGEFGILFVPEHAAPVAAAAPPDAWTSKMPPARYLERYPNGPRAAHAKQVLAQGG